MSLCDPLKRPLGSGDSSDGNEPAGDGGDGDGGGISGGCGGGGGDNSDGGMYVCSHAFTV